MKPGTLTRFAWLSIAAAVATILLKAWAYALTGSVGLLSDALESFVNLAGALMALAMLGVPARPPDEEHPMRSQRTAILAATATASSTRRT